MLVWVWSAPGFRVLSPGKEIGGYGCLCSLQVDFTRCLYAKLLRQQNLGVPRNSGFKTLPSSHPQHKAYDLGMKLVSHY